MKFIRHITKGDKVMQDMEQIYEQYFETVYKYLFCLTHNSDIAEELTQETFEDMQEPDATEYTLIENEQ